MSEAAVQSVDRRPVLVVVILWAHVLVAFALAWISFRLVTGHARLRTPAAFYAAAAVILMTVKVWGAIALYRLRRSAVSIFLTAVLLNLPVTIVDVYRHPHGYRPSSAFAMLAGVVFAAGTCLYALYLSRVGRLR